MPEPTSPRSSRSLRDRRALLGGLLACAVMALAVWFVLEHRRYEHARASLGRLELRDAGKSYVGYIADPEEESIALVSSASKGAPISLEGAMKTPHAIFATNAGIFSRSNDPVGLAIADGRELHPIERASGDGNFYLEPNGVFAITDEERARVIPSDRYALSTAQVKLATQSGPMLVIDGALHPALREDSPNLRIRSGVGVRRDGKIVFLVSKDPVRFWELATLFRDGFGCENALYLDGTISGAAFAGEEPTTQNGFAAVIVVARGATASGDADGS